MHHMVGDESDLMDDLSLGEQDRLMGMDMDVGSPSVRRTGTGGGGRVGGEVRGKEVRKGAGEREEGGGEKIVLPRPKSRVKSSRLSLFARPQDQEEDEDEQEDEPRDRNHQNPHTNDDYIDDESETDHTQTSTTSTPRTHTHSQSQSQPRDRDRDQQKLKESLWELKKMVQVFEGFETSLRASKAGNEVSLGYCCSSCFSSGIMVDLWDSLTHHRCFSCSRCPLLHFSHWIDMRLRVLPHPPFRTPPLSQRRSELVPDGPTR
jgi:hypothetical protein